MVRRLALLDPFGRLSPPCLVQTWLTTLIGFHCLWVLASLVMGRWMDLVYYTAMLGGLVVAVLASHPALKVGLLAAWVGWWTYFFARWPGLHPGIVLMMGMSAYVAARVAWAWRREGAEAVRVGARRPLVSTLDWPELSGLTQQERRLVLGRARGALPRPRAFSYRFLFILVAGLAVTLLELFFPPRATDSHPRTVQPGLIAIVAVLVTRDPREDEEALRRALREHVLPGFWREPWNWDRTRREAAGRAV